MIILRRTSLLKENTYQKIVLRADSEKKLIEIKQEYFKTQSINEIKMTYDEYIEMDKLVKEFSIDPLQVHEFKLNLQPDENDFMLATMELISEGVLANDDELEANIDKFNEGLKDIQKKAEETIW